MKPFRLFSACTGMLLMSALATADVELPHGEIVLGGSNGVVPTFERSISAGLRYGAHLGYHQAPMSAPVVNQFYIGNRGSDTLTVWPATLFGTDAPDFTSNFPTQPFTLNPGESTSFIAGFQRQTAGHSTAEIRFATNDPNVTTYILRLDGAAYDVVPDLLDLRLLSLKPPKAKLHKKTGLIKVKLKLLASNIGEKPAIGPVIRYRTSLDMYMDEDLDAVSGDDLQLPDMLPGTSKKVKATLMVLPSSRYVFSEIAAPLGLIEHEKLQNILRLEIPQ